MITIIEVDLHSRKPIYEQLIDNITMLVMSGALAPDEQVMSVRQLAVSLAVNPNTVQKAFTELEKRGVLYSVAGRGRFVNGNISSFRKTQSDAQLNELKTLVMKMKSSGIEYERIIDAVKSVYSEYGEKEENK